MRTFHLSLLSALLSIMTFSTLANAETLSKPQIEHNSFVFETIPTPGKIELYGVHAYNPHELLDYTLALSILQDNKLSPEKLSTIIELIYREDGFLLSEVSWDFDDANKILRLYIQEGKLDQIIVHGVNTDDAQSVQNYFNPLLNNSALHEKDLERSLALSNDLAGMDIKTTLKPSNKGHDLHIDVSQMKTRGSANLEFIPMHSGYAKRLTLQEELYSLISTGDQLRINLTATDEPSDSQGYYGTLNYRTPIGADGNYLEAMAGTARSSHTIEGFDDKSDARGFNASLSWGYAYLRDLYDYGYWIGTLEHSDSTSQLGYTDYDSEANVARASFVRGHTLDNGGLIQFSATASTGARPSTPDGQIDDGEKRFSHLRASFGISGPWNIANSILTYRFESAMQWSSHSLPSVEKIALGHYPFLRGYAPSEAMGDKGAAGTFEIVYRGSALTGLSLFKPFIFISAGSVSSVDYNNAKPDSWTLASSGIGLRVPFGSAFYLESWAALPLRDGPIAQNGDEAYYLLLQYQW